MRKILLYAALISLLCGQTAHGQQGKADSPHNQQQAKASPSPSPFASSYPQIDNKAEAERKAHQEERDAKDDAFREDQAGQNRLIANATFWMTIFAGVNLLVAIVYAVFAGFTWVAVKKQARHAEETVGKMSDQLEAIKNQEQHLSVQAEAAKHQAEQMLSQAKAQWNSADAMVVQARILAESVVETRKLVAQNERAVAAAEKNTQIAEMANAPYFGIIGITYFDFSAGYYPTVSIVFFNGGKTPAWHFYPMACFVVGDHPSHGAVYNLKLETLDIEATFFASTGSHNFKFRPSEFVMTEDIRENKPGADRLFLVVTVEYRGRGSKDTERQSFTMIWHEGKFCNWIVA